MLSLVVIAGLALAPEASALSLVRMNVDEMTRRAGQVFRGEVLGRTDGTTEAGGGRVPVTIYRIRVDEEFKGKPGAAGGNRVVELRMLGDHRPATSGTRRYVGGIRELPRLEVGRSYVLFSTQPSAIGLSTTVGLGQGCFRISGDPGREKAVNAYDNLGLFGPEGAAVSATPRGPVAYDRLAAAIRAALVAK